jgi:hypothetical protein
MASSEGVRILHSYGPAVLVVECDPNLVTKIAAHPGILGIYSGPVEEEIPDLDETGRMGIAAWNQTQSPTFKRAKKERRDEGRPWDFHDPKNTNER